MTLLVLGTRPSFIMGAPIVRGFARAGLPLSVLDTRQHYSDDMSAVFYAELGLAPPDHVLSDPTETSDAGRLAARIVGVDACLAEARPDCVLVLGDTDSNLAAALAARKRNLLLGHVEAGERSGDLRSPEEQNRRVIDHIADFHLATNAKSAANLTAESISPERIHVVGNPIVDAVLDIAPEPPPTGDAGRYVLLTLHRQETVDAPDRLEAALREIAAAAAALGVPVVFPIHPRTAKRVEEFGLTGLIEAPAFDMRPPQGYRAFTRLLRDAAAVITDSGGVQQEACILGTPAITLMDATPWPETVEIGANRLVRPGVDPLQPALADALAAGAVSPAGRTLFGDYGVGARIATVTAAEIAKRA